MTTSNNPIHPGQVAWTGENPGIYLKENGEGPWTGLATFFRITWSQYGRGHGILVLDEPNVEQGLPETHNFLICDNQPLARYLVDEFFSNFASFRVSPGLKAIRYLPLTAVRREGDPRSTYSELVQAEDLEVRMTWKALGMPYAVDMPPELGPTKRHEMYSLFIDAEDAEVTINDRPLRGRLTTRNCGGTTKSSAFLAMSESWMQSS